MWTLLVSLVWANEPVASPGTSNAVPVGPVLTDCSKQTSTDAKAACEKANTLATAQWDLGNLKGCAGQTGDALTTCTTRKTELERKIGELTAPAAPTKPAAPTAPSTN